MGRSLALKSKMEFEGQGAAAAPEAPAPAAIPKRASEARRISPAEGDDRPAPVMGRHQGLQERFSFETFVPGPSNEFAFAVARRVASWADGHFNPVLFHGPYGFGKTHLLNALAWEAMQTGEAKRVVYLTAERFTSTFVRAIQDRQTAAFKAELRNADLLLIDDVHFVAGKQNTQEELFHTLIALIEDGRRVVLTADRSPSDLSDMEPRLRSHLQSGLVCGIEPADRTLRLGILERKLAILAQAGGFLPSARSEVLQFLADRFTDSVRELEGALNTLVARVGGDIARLGLDEAQAILRPHLACSEKRVTVDQIQKAVAEHYGLKQADIISERRARVVARPRQAAMWIAKQITTRSLPDIGRRFGGRDHTTVLHAVRRIEALKQDDAVLARDLDAIIRKLRS
jgi:chromosomal replication initiator protein